LEIIKTEGEIIETEGKTFRTGIGYDVHKLTAGKKLVLGGVAIEHFAGLAGHSDADVLVHAIMDALLGAAGLSDIGVYFPDTDMKYKDISSMALLCMVKMSVKEAGYRILNIDSIVILEEPKISSFIPLMKKNISEVLEISIGQIGIKATTSEGLGFCGSKEGAAAQSMALLAPLVE
jgi:2-C-methyl-D-erythritol 2,4-cyclodiphosphate synthase